MSAAQASCHVNQIQFETVFIRQKNARSGSGDQGFIHSITVMQRGDNTDVRKQRRHRREACELIPA